jgi:amidase
MTHLTVPRVETTKPDLCDLDASKLAGAVRRREASALDVIDAHLARIERVNPQLNAIVTLDAEGARERARQADAALARGDLWGPLHGVPFTLKDMHGSAGLPASMGTRSSQCVPREDGVVAERLKAAGAILLGKTNMAMNAQTVSELFGRTNNPYNLSRTPGGSSGGAAAAVAARLTAFDVGTDMSGSIRMPAHFCGVFGLKPTQHRIPQAGMITGPVDLPRIDRQLGVSGPLARSAADIALLFRVLAGADVRDPEVAPVPIMEAPRLQPNVLKIALAPSLAGVPCSREIRSALERLGARLEQAGVRVEVCDLPFSFDTLLAAFRALLRGPMSVLAGVGLTPPTSVLEDTPAPSIADFMRALDERDRLILAFERFVSGYDAFICPTTMTTAFPHSPPGSPIEVDAEPLPSLHIDHACICATLTGSPALIVPIALSADGLPIGAQLIGRRFTDERLIEVGRVIAEVVGRLPSP